MKHQPLPTAAQWICACGNRAHTTGQHPDGWEWHGSKLLCGDCVRIAAFSYATDDRAHRAAPIRHAGPVDAATAILLRSGAYLDLADPDCTRIAAVDIAAGLRQLRFTGQTREPYTIAQHSLLVLQLVEPLARSIGGSHGDALRWCALLHDAPEAFIHDITRPLKGMLPDYRRIESEFEARFAAAFGVQWNARRKTMVKHADLQALAIERRDLCPDTADRRSWPILAAITPEVIAAVSIRRVWSAAEAEERFLDAFNQLRPGQQRELAA